jgi:ATP-binding cassette subfamily B multidrug efflux pump
MIKLAKFLKPHILPLILCVGLLFGQAMCDLSLPNLMSDIVNVGIQQSGIEETVPKAMSEKGLQLMKTFMTAEQKQLAEENYRLVTAGSQEAEDLKATYPLAGTENVYLLEAKDEGALAALDAAFGESTMTFVSFMKQMAEEQGSDVQGQTDDASMTESLENVDFDELYAMLPMLQQMPEAAFDEARESAKSLDDSLLSQMGTVMTRLFYTELGVNVGNIQSNYILRTGIYMLLLTLAGALATVLVSLLATRIAAGVARALRSAVFRKVENFANAEFDQFSTASLITRTTNDVTQVQMLLIMGIRMICYAPIMGVGGIVMAVGKSTSMTWIIALGVVILIGIMLAVFFVAMPKFKLVQKLVDKLNLVTRENLSGMMVIRAFGTQKFEEKRFEKANRELTDNHLFVNRVMVFMMPAMMFMMNVISLIIVWVGGHQIEQATMQVGDMMAFMQYAMQIIMAFLMISMMFIMVPRAAVSGDRIAEVLATEPSIRDPKEPKTLGRRARGEIEFRDVSFRYGNAEDDVLQDISFTAKPGQTTAFIGSTGSGKSTLINLIPRFYDVTGGKILLDGVDIRDLSQHELRENIGFVPQKGVLFSGDINSNLRYGKHEATDEELKLAADIAQATEFIENTPDRMETEISQGGTNVSGGQKQRLSIARALVKQAPVYIFDDSFSALDFKTDAALRRALKKYTGDSTVLIVAQRVSTIMNAEQIIVLDDGKIVGKGTHKELLKTCETYREIAESQLSKEELQ